MSQTLVAIQTEATFDGVNVLCGKILRDIPCRNRLQYGERDEVLCAALELDVDHVPSWGILLGFLINARRQEKVMKPQNTLTA